jgi:tetratricopeptide (TPR) repeat protein
MKQSVEYKMTTGALLPKSPYLAPLLSASLLLLAGCQNPFLSDRDNDIKESTQALETARDDAQRSKAYSTRGAAYSEKARFSRITKQIPTDEYERLFDLAMKDHNQAVALNPASAQVYANRAQAYYDRGSLDLVENKDGSKQWFDPAAADFSTAIEKDPRNTHSIDMLGLTYESNGEYGKAIEAYTRELALDPFGKQRLSDVYCNLGFHREQQKDLPAAAAAYQKSIEFGTADDKSCPMNPSAQLAAIKRTH